MFLAGGENYPGVLNLVFLRCEKPRSPLDNYKTVSPRKPSNLPELFLVLPGYVYDLLPILLYSVPAPIWGPARQSGVLVKSEHFVKPARFHEIRPPSGARGVTFEK